MTQGGEGLVEAGLQQGGRLCALAGLFQCQRVQGHGVQGLEALLEAGHAAGGLLLRKEGARAGGALTELGQQGLQGAALLGGVGGVVAEGAPGEAAEVDDRGAHAGGPGGGGGFLLDERGVVPVGRLRGDEKLGGEADGDKGA